MTKPLATERDEYAAELANLTDAIDHACRQLRRLMVSYRLDTCGLDAAHPATLAGLDQLRQVVENIAPAQAGLPTRKPPHLCRLDLAGQLDEHRAHAVQCARLVGQLPLTDEQRGELGLSTSIMSSSMHAIAMLSRVRPRT